MLAIKNYGHFWSRELVDFGQRGSPGRLLGSTKINSEKDETIDFRNQTGIYCLYSDNREIVYVGQTGRGNQRLLSRLRQHSCGPMRDRWQNFSWFGFRSVEGREISQEADLQSKENVTYAAALDEIEAVLVQLLEPRLNKQGPRWSGAEEYFQWADFDASSLSTLRHEVWVIHENVKRLLEAQGLASEE
ncbi:GIY-YIG nuclease family protein [Sagittula sp. MA-2]|jgi:hypothetical protein|uniref:GIY-YIG nuclease family protein n=1 Tax=Sagittula sp. MA-2 TaxID=3048007 RepID=UPI0024C2B442|nr:GIY-YIG nuclease family protein [Sagittula sp. MA-2]WHZ36275.1 GIY-YIG nuclease family protein [Sagittula sp. MA-2]